MKTRIPSVLITFALVCFALVQNTQAVVPAPDGGYPGFNTAEGQNALFSLTTGVGNAAVGWYSLFSNTDGSFNTALGAGTLLFNIGDQAALFGIQNTAVGTAALLFNTTGSDNTANGVGALSSNTTGDRNTAVGSGALRQNVDANYNTAVGFKALFANTSGGQNTAIGNFTLLNNTEGNYNTAVGSGALSSTTSGFGENTAVGSNALSANTSGGFNTAVGGAALSSSTGENNTALGKNAGMNVHTASNVICIGAPGADVGNSCFIGQIYSNVQPIVGTDPDSVTITSSGRLGRGNVSSRRYKHDIQPMEKASELLYALKPVSFRYNKEYDATQTLAFGLIAEEVAEVYPDLVGRNPQGDAESVRYEQINAMLLNEFLKEHRTVQEQGATVAELKKQIATLIATVKEQTAQIQKVSAQLEASKPAPQVANNP